MKGTSVIVIKPHGTELDRFGNEIFLYDRISVDDVLVEPGATANLEASRPEGVQVVYTLHFPKSFTESLEGCKVELPNPWNGVYRVIGNPGRYMDANTPTRWNMPVEVELAYG